MVTISSASRLALQNIKSISAQLEVTQGRISSGLKVASAKDDAVIWRAAAGIRSDIKTYETINSSLNNVKAAANVAAAGVDAVATTLATMKTKISAYQATSDSATRNGLWTEISALQGQLTTAISGAAYKGSNYLDNASAVTFVSSTDADGTPVTDTFTPTNIKTLVNATAIAGTNNLATFLTTFTQAEAGDSSKATDIVAAITTQLSAVTGYAAGLGGLVNKLDSQQALISKLSSIKETALGSLVDANMEEESAKLQSLQVKQQLAYQALSISNGSAQNILRLFQ